MGGGLNAMVESFAVFDDGSGGALYAGLSATSASPVLVVKWDGSTWSNVASALGVPDTVRALTVFDDGSGAVLVAGGEFSQLGGIVSNGIARWDGAGWSTLGGGLPYANPSVRTLAVHDDGSGAALYAGGEFRDSGGALVETLVRWDGTQWTSLGSGSGMNAPVQALAVYDDGSGPGLFVGGDFEVSAAGDSHLAKWGCAIPQGASTFCTPKTTLVCGPPSISALGASSTTASSGFVIRVAPARGCRAGLLLYSNQAAVPGVPFGGPGDGLLCLSPSGLRRAGPVDSGGTSPAFCDGVLAIDMNSFHALQWSSAGCSPIAGQNNPAGFLGVPGTPLRAQMWARDSVSTGQLISDGLSWTQGP